MAILGLLQGRTLIYIKLDNIESISKANLADDSGEIVMSSGNVITITDGLNDFVTKVKTNVPPSGNV